MFNHKHNWKYMFSAGDNNAYNWFYCNECLAQCVATLDTSTGKVVLEEFALKPKERRRR